MEVAPELQSAFPGLRVLELKMDGLIVEKSNPALDSFSRDVQERVRRGMPSLDAVKNQPIFRAYRDFFWRVGIDPTKTRPAGEALTRRVLGGRELPRVNTMVDAYNLVSLETSVAIAAFDRAKVREDALAMRRAMSGESFLGIGMTSADALSGVEVVIEDQATHRLIAVYPYRDSDESRITKETTDVLFMMCGVPGIDDATLGRARDLTRDYVERFCRLPR